MIHLTPDSLLEHNYVLHETVKHNELNAFLRQNKIGLSILKIVYNFSLIVATCTTLYLLITAESPIEIKVLVMWFGVIFAFILVPIHELIHYLPYKYFGAKVVTFKAYYKQGYFLTSADQYVVDEKKLNFIALAPFVLISLACIVSILVSGDIIQLGLSISLLIHTTLCSSDFQILDYFKSNDSKVVMFSDTKSETTYFYRKLISSAIK